MENGVDRLGRPSGDEQLTMSGDRLFAQPALSRRRQNPPFKKTGRSLTRRRGERTLLIALVLLIMAVCVSAGLLVLRVRAETEAIKKWSFQAGFGVAFSPIVANGMVYALYDKDMLFENHVMYALDARSGRVQWDYRLIGFVPFAPILANNIVYVVSDDLPAGESTMYALDALSGREKWVYQTVGGSWSSPLVVSGIMYNNSKDGNLYALDALSGNRLWTRHMGGDSFVSPTVANGAVYVLTEDSDTKESTLYALDADTGHKKWSYRESFPAFFNSQPVVANGTVFVLSSEGTLYALDAVTGQKKWFYQQWSYQMGSLNYAVLIVFNGVVYVDGGYFDGSNYQGHLYALDARSGNRIWADQDQMIPETPEVVAGNAYLLSTNGSLYVLDAVTGHQKWAFQVGKPNSNLPEPVVVNGIVYIVTANSTLHVLNGVSGHEEWSYETEGFDWLPPTVTNGTVYVDDLDKLDAIQPPATAS